MTNPIVVCIVSAFKQYFGTAEIDINANFFDLGISSLEMAGLSQQLSNAIDREIPILTLYEYPTIAKLAEHLQSS